MFCCGFCLCKCCLLGFFVYAVLWVSGLVVFFGLVLFLGFVICLGFTFVCVVLVILIGFLDFAFAGICLLFLF